MMGDRDFYPLIKSVKDFTGKRVFGVVFDKHYSDDLAREFDQLLVLKEKDLSIFD